MLMDLQTVNLFGSSLAVSIVKTDFKCKIYELHSIILNIKTGIFLAGLKCHHIYVAHFCHTFENAL